MRKLIWVHWIQKRNGNSWGEISSIICLHKFYFIGFRCLMWWGNMTIQMQKGDSQNLLSRQYHVHYWRLIHMKLITIPFISHWYYLEQENHHRTVLRIPQGTGMGGKSLKHWKISLKEEIWPLEYFTKQINTMNNFIIWMKVKFYLNASLTM